MLEGLSVVRSVPGEVGASEADAAEKDKAQKAALAALGETLEVFRKFYLDGKSFIGGDNPSIADVRLAASLEFLNAIDYDFPAWTKTYMSAVETALGEAYAEPAGDETSTRHAGAQEVVLERRCDPSGANNRTVQAAATGSTTKLLPPDVSRLARC